MRTRIEDLNPPKREAYLAWLQELGQRISDGRLPSWLLGFGVAMLGWHLAYAPPGSGIDPSWGAGLFMAFEAGLRFGNEIVFTYGPLGFLRVSGAYSPDLAALAWVYRATIYLLMCIGIIEVLRRSLGPWLASALTLIPLVLFEVFLAEQVFVLAVVLAVLALRTNPNPRAVQLLLYGGAALAALEMLTKFSAGPTVLAAIAIAVLGVSEKFWQPVRFLALFLTLTVGLWVIAGQNVFDLPAYIENSLEISSGYREAMVNNELPEWQAVFAFALCILLVGAAYRGDYPGTRKRIAATVMFALVAFVLFKQATWRFNVWHLTICLATLNLLWLAVPRDLTRKYIMVGVTLLLAFGSLYVLSLNWAQPRANLLSNARVFVSNLRTVVDSTRKENVVQAGRENLKALYDLSPRVLAEARRGTIMVDPHDISLAWAYGLDWHPAPVFQNYTAYTGDLDRLNARFIKSADGPSRIIRPVPRPEECVQGDPICPVVDTRVPAWDPPAQQRAIYCNFSSVEDDGRWEVLKRTANRCGKLELIRSVKTEYGKTVDVPKPRGDEVVVLRIDGAQVSGWERYLAIVSRARKRMVIINGNESRPRRLVPGTAADGLMVGGGEVRSDGRLPVEIPQVRTLRLEGLDGELRYEFFRMRLRETTYG